MSYLLCSLYNSDTNEYSAPFLSKTKKTAIAEFTERINAAFSKSKSFDPNDWSLVCLGNFDTAKGKIVLLSANTTFACGKDVVDDDYDDEVK